MSVEIKKLPNSEIEIIAEVSAEEFDKFWSKAIKRISKNFKMSGFRPGNVPEKVLIEQATERVILEKTGELVIQEVFPKIVKERKLDVVGQPHASITKIARGSDFGFKIVVAVLPEIKLPENFREIARRVMSKKEEIKVEEKEIEQALEQLRKMKASKEVGQAGGEKILPELNDEFAKSLSDGRQGVGKFETLNDLKNALKENINYEKEMKQKEKKKVEALDAILKEIIIEIPKVLIDGEKNTMLRDFKASIVNMGMNWEDYLKQWKKTDLSAEALDKAEKELLKGWSEEALKRVKYGLLLQQLSTEFDMKINDNEIEEKIKTFHLQDEPAQGEAGKVDRQKLKDYAYGVLRNEKIFSALGGLASG